MTAFKPISEDLLKELTQPAEVYTSTQVGPLRWFDREMRCLSKRCGAPTYLKVNGVALCWVHAIRRLNEIIVEMEGRYDGNASSGINAIAEQTEESAATNGSVGTHERSDSGTLAAS